MLISKDLHFTSRARGLLSASPFIDDDDGDDDDDDDDDDGDDHDDDNDDCISLTDRVTGRTGIEARIFSFHPLKFQSNPLMTILIVMMIIKTVTMVSR